MSGSFKYYRDIIEIVCFKFIVVVCYRFVYIENLKYLLYYSVVFYVNILLHLYVIAIHGNS